MVGDISDQELPVVGTQRVQDNRLQFPSLIFDLDIQVEAGNEGVGLHPHADAVRLGRERYPGGGFIWIQPVHELGQGAIGEVVAEPGDVGEPRCIHGEDFGGRAGRLAARSETEHHVFHVFEFPGLAQHLVYPSLCQEGRGDPQVRSLLEEDSLDLAALKGPADGGRKDAEPRCQYEQEDEPCVLEGVARHMQQSNLQPDGCDTVESDEDHEQQLSGHDGHQPPSRDRQEVAGHGWAQCQEPGDKRGLNDEADVTMSPVAPAAFREPICEQYGEGCDTGQEPDGCLGFAFAPVHPYDRRDHRRPHQQIDDAVGLAADVPDDHGEEPHEHERHDDQEENGGDEEHLVYLRFLEEAAVHELSALLEFPVDEAAEYEQSEVEVVSLEEGESEWARGLEPANEHTALGAEHVGHDEYRKAEQTDA